MSEIKFASFSKAEDIFVERIMDGWTRMFFEAQRNPPDRMTMRMDLSAAHAEHPLRLKELAEAADAREFDAAHDLMGIYRHMDRETGKLGGCFVPRFARHS